MGERRGNRWKIRLWLTGNTLEYFLDLSRKSKEDWSSIFQNAEKLAARLKLMVIRTSEGLAIAADFADPF